MAGAKFKAAEPLEHKMATGSFNSSAFPRAKKPALRSSRMEVHSKAGC